MSKIKLVFTPIHVLMGHLRFNNKFILILIITVLGYIPGTYFTYHSISAGKQTAQHELQGVNYYLAALPLYYDLLKGFNAASLNDSKNILTQASDKMDDLYHIDKEMDNPFKNTSLIDTLQNAIKNGTQGMASDSFRATILKEISQYNQILDNIVGYSELALDPDYDSYFLMDTVAVQMYQLLQDYYKLSQLLTLNTAPSTNTDRISEFVLRYGISARIDTIITDLNKSLSANTDLKGYTERVIPLLTAIKADVNPDAASVNMSQFSGNQSALYTATVDGLNILKGLLDNRVSKLQYSLWRALIITFLALLLVIYCIIGLTQMLRQSISILIQTIKSISDGDLSKKIPYLGKDELNEIADYMSTMQNNLSQMINEINDVSSSVNLSSNEIASGNNELSMRTQDQASCLVETSASLNILTNTIKNNADSAKEAADLSGDATQVAEKGGVAVNQVISTMDDINQSAQKIQEITGVIDSIAFQTNLLALNASVEAARAGEQGRGFAVVASEVRNLAQRSAEAAKQIKGLINDSMIKVAAGDAQVKFTYGTMQDIVNSIRGVNQIIGTISLASAEQSSSIEQINIVISQLEGNTQKNAAQVEEVAASAELLRDQSSKLIEVVSQFNTNDQ